MSQTIERKESSDGQHRTGSFRRRVLLTGVLAATVVIGGAGAMLAVSQIPDAAPTQATGQIEDVSYEDATPLTGTV